MTERILEKQQIKVRAFLRYMFNMNSLNFHGISEDFERVYRRFLILNDK